MSDWARVDRKFHAHPKAQRAGLAAIGLWTLANSWSRDHRTGGLISFDCELLQGAQDPVDALVRERLWIKTALGYMFNDWDQWNSDEHPKTSAAKMVHAVVPPGHPVDVQLKLGNQVAALLEEGIEYSIVQAALKLWLSKPAAAPSWLPMFVSDIVKKGGSGERDAALRDAWKTGDTKQLARFGLVFTPPDIPLEITSVPEAKAFMLRHKKAWIEQVRKAA